MYAIRQVPAMPPATLSRPMAANSAQRLCSWNASQMNKRLLIGPANAPITRARINPYRATASPPTKTPSIVMPMPKIFRTSAISTSV